MKVGREIECIFENYDTERDSSRRHTVHVIKIQDLQKRDR